MVYGAQAILPSDIPHDAPRVAAYDEDDAEESRRLDVDLLEEAVSYTHLTLPTIA